ncbi:MAG: dUTP diphosphatase [Clostridia bacterium]|nr:dUTP diphosphatase [Clostridia bacterium]
MEMKVKKLRENAVLPKSATKGSAGMDLYAAIENEIVLNPGERVLIPTGFAAEIPEGTAGFIFTRSGLGIKKGIHVTNGVGVVDSDYRGEIHVGLHNLSQEAYTIAPLERIAQMIIMPYFAVDVIEAEALDETDRGAGGFGSTGTK